MVRFTDREQAPVYIDVFDGGKLYPKEDLQFQTRDQEGDHCAHAEEPGRRAATKPGSQPSVPRTAPRNLIG